MQSYFREHAIADTNRKSRSHDQRLLLLHDVEDLVGAAVHASTAHGHGLGTVFERRLEAYATAASRHGQRLSNTEYASQALLKAAVTDIATRHEAGDEVFLTAYVHHENRPSQRCLERHAWSQRRNGGAPWLLYSVRLDVAQKAHGITPHRSGPGIVAEQPVHEQDHLH
ncbi:hypothetical protein [Streptomyces parvulus]|uniref:hypothetical protein n=1 Tax=Streptomyces parvulus TaxID=146923 RepID=UPI0033AC01A4